jgi:hypothetical protein
VRRSGALQLQQSLVAFPDAEPFVRAVARIRAAVTEVGGTALAVIAEPVDDADEQRLRSAWNEARADEYGELINECEKLVAEIEDEFGKQKFTLAELDEEEAELDKLGRWRERIAERDVCGSERAEEARLAFERAADAVARYTDAVFARTHGDVDATELTEPPGETPHSTTRPQGDRHR